MNERSFNVGDRQNSDKQLGILADNLCRLLEAIAGSGCQFGYEVGPSGGTYHLVEQCRGERKELGEAVDIYGESVFYGVRLWQQYTGTAKHDLIGLLAAVGERHQTYFAAEERREPDPAGYGKQTICWDIKLNGRWLAHVVGGDPASDHTKILEIVLEPEEAAGAQPSPSDTTCIEKGRIGRCWHLATLHPHLRG